MELASTSEEKKVRIIATAMNEINRRKSFKKTGALSASIFLAPDIALLGNDESQIEKWQAMMKDPVYDMFKGKPDLDKNSRIVPPATG